MKTTHTVLADGRDLFYFDERDDAVRELVDPRPLEPVRPDSRMRYDPLRDEWITIASHRQSRTYLPPADQCPLCPSREGRQTEIPADDYDVAVFENRFPSFASSLADVAPHESGPFVERPAAGRCEVVCFSADHDAAFWDLSPARVRTVVDAWASRTAALEALPFVEQVYCFENRGREIGVTLSHPHGQIYAFPYVTPVTARMLDSARRHRSRTGGDLFAELLAAEQTSDRVVAQSSLWTAFVPYAARWPLEVHLYPNRRVASLPELTDAERDDFSAVYLDVLRRMGALYEGNTPYISAWHQAPVRADRDLAYLHLEVFSIRRAADKLKYLAGTESGMGAYMNDVTPEAAALALREVLP